MEEYLQLCQREPMSLSKALGYQFAGNREDKGTYLNLSHANQQNPEDGKVQKIKGPGFTNKVKGGKKDRKATR